MPEFILVFVLIIPQLAAGLYARSIGKSFWFWFLISFIIPVISLIVLLIIDNKESKGKPKKTGYKLADHVREKQETDD